MRSQLHTPVTPTRRHRASSLVQEARGSQRVKCCQRCRPPAPPFRTGPSGKPRNGFVKNLSWPSPRGRGPRARYQPFLASTRDARPEVRQAATRGLRHFHDPEVASRLASMVRDVHATVQRSALRGLSQQEDLPDDALESLHAAVDTERLDRLNAPLLVTVLVRHVGQPVARATMQSLLHFAHDDAKLRARIRSVLRRGG